MQFEVLVIHGKNIVEMKENLCRILNEEYEQAKIVNLEVTRNDQMYPLQFLTAIIEYNYKGKIKYSSTQMEKEEPSKKVKPYWDGPCECNRNPCICPYSPKDL